MTLLLRLAGLDPRDKLGCSDFAFLVKMLVSHDLSRWTPSHAFHEGNPEAERGARRVVWLTLATMLVEIVAGWYYNSMALLADGWHMSSHVVAIGLAVLAYGLARRHATDHRFAFGTWKIEILGGFASAAMLLGVALLMIVESGERLVSPRAIGFDQAIAVAVIGLVINLLSARLLHAGHDHHHGADHHDDPAHDHDHGHHDGHSHDHESPHAHGHDAAHADLNLRSAYLHVLADAATSVLAIAALLGGKFLGWVWLDPLMGVVGGVVVGVWAVGLLRDTGSVLLDREADLARRNSLVSLVGKLPGGDVEVADVHLWRVGRTRYACILTLVTHRTDLTPESIRAHLAARPEIVHVTVEINRCATCSAAP